MRIERKLRPVSETTELVVKAESHAEARAVADVLGAIYALEFDRLNICDPFGRSLLVIDGPIHVQGRHELNRGLLEAYRSKE